MSEIRELAMRIFAEHAAYCDIHDEDAVDVVSAAMREAYARTIAIAGDSEHEAKPRGHYDQLGDSAQTRWNIEAAIRAEAAKLETN